MQVHEKDILSQTMHRLILSINNNKQQQLKIFESLSKEDILKILQNFQHSQVSIRKMSAKLLTQLTYDNNHIKGKLIDILNVYPAQGNIILNKIPRSIVNCPDKVMEILKVINSNNCCASSKQLGWYINPQSSNTQVQIISSNTFSSQDFLDPSENIFGISYSNPDIKIDVPTLMFKQTDRVPSSATKYYNKHQPTSNSSQKPKLTFSGRQRGNTIIPQSNIQPQSKIGQLCFRTDKYIRYNNMGAATDRSKIDDKSPSPSHAPLTSSVTFKSKDYQIKGNANLMRFGIDITSPTSVNSNPVRFKNQRSEQKRQTIILGGNKNTYSKDLTTSVNNSLINNTPLQKNQQFITFSSSKSPTLSNHKNHTAYTSSTPNNNLNHHKIDYTKIISQFKNTPKQAIQTKMYGDYKPSNDFLRKIKQSIKTKD